MVSSHPSPCRRPIRWRWLGSERWASARPTGSPGGASTVTGPRGCSRGWPPTRFCRSVHRRPPATASCSASSATSSAGRWRRAVRRRSLTALVSYLESLGGSVECGRPIASLADLPPSRVVLLDVSPRQVVGIAGDRLPARYRRSLERFRYGPGVCKVDWVLDGPIPWADPDIARTATVHLGGTLAEIVAVEDDVQRGRHPDRPFVLLAQQSLFDPTRAPQEPTPAGRTATCPMARRST